MNRPDIRHTACKHPKPIHSQSFPVAPNNRVHVPKLTTIDTTLRTHRLSFMKKIFIKLYLLIICTIILGLVIVVTVFYPVLNAIEKKDDRRIMKGVFELAVQEFEESPKSNWGHQLEGMQKASGALVAMIPLTEVEALGEKELSGIRTGRLLSVGKEDTFYRRLTNSDQVLRMTPGIHGSFWYTGEDERVTTLTVYLVSRSLQHHRDVTLEQTMDTLQPSFGFPISLNTFFAVSNDPKASQMMARKGIWVDEEEDIIWCHLADFNCYLVLGPLGEGEHYLLRNAFYGVIGLFLGLIGVCAFLWTRPLWKDLDVLTGVAERFRKGDLSARVNTSKGSAVYGLAEEFNAMAGQIQREIAYRIELADAISHELRTPLARLEFAFGVMEESHDSQEREHLSQEMHLNIDELNMLIQELLVFSRMEHGGANPEFREVHLERWMTHCVDQFKQAHPKIIVLTHCQLPAPDETGMFEERLMARALGNLISNALRYAESTVSVTMARHGDMLSLVVEDDGCGIARTDRDKVFVPFMRLDESRDRESGNHGLGLAIVRSIIGRHDGDIRIEDSPLGGALIRITWPVAPQGYS